MMIEKKYLLIDDSNTAILIMRSMLNVAGISNNSIDSTMDSLKAIRLLAAHSYDIVIIICTIISMEVSFLTK